MKDRMFYPAVFQVEEDEGYSIWFPDVEGCITQGETIEEGYEMAFDALGNVLSYLKDSKKDLPSPSPPEKIQLEERQFLTIIEFNMKEYKRKHDSKAVKKTLTIPSWLNEEALERNINFSQVLQDALLERIGSR